MDNRAKGKIVAWTLIVGAFVGIWGVDRVLNGEDEAPPPAEVSDFLPTQEDCENDPSLMGC